MASDGGLDPDTANGATPPARALGLSIAAAPDALTVIKLAGCRDRSCAFFENENEGDASTEVAALRLASSSTSTSTDARGSAGSPSFPAIGTSALAFPSVPTLVAPYSVVSSYSPMAAVAYARKWALSTNPAYERFGQDCTNFISQALFEGGWHMVDNEDVCEDVYDTNVWWYRRNACLHMNHHNTHCSRTWGQASRLYWFLMNSGRTAVLNHVWDLQPGDVLQKDYGDGYIKHSLILSEKTEDNLYFCSHDDDYVNMPFFGKGGIVERNRNHKWYAFHIL